MGDACIVDAPPGGPVENVETCEMEGAIGIDVLGVDDLGYGGIGPFEEREVWSG